MVVFLENRKKGCPSERKWRLFACGCCRVFFWERLPDHQCKDAIEVSERYADGQAQLSELEQARELAAQARRDYEARRERQQHQGVGHQGPECVCCAIRPTMSHDPYGVIQDMPKGSELKQRTLIRCVFGNQFGAVVVQPNWISDTVQSVGRVIYQERKFQELSILADALEDAGCNETSILEHLRSPGPHVRGCWALDLVLGKQ